MRHRTGLRNRLRGGKSTYSVKGKNQFADRYSSMVSGKPQGMDRIAGRPVLAIRPRGSKED